jgi:predicted nucleic-acid-binding protein
VIGLDTNVLVRYLAQDDRAQAAAATRLVDGFTAEAPGFISTVTLVETVWVLTRAYRTPKAQITHVIEGLLRSQDLVIEQAEVHYLALGLYRVAPVDFADAVIAQAGRRAGCTQTVTFDRGVAKWTRMGLLADIE